jgi:peptide/nickel transport system substrate-binding protein
MRLSASLSLAALSSALALLAPAGADSRPRYGGTLRVDIAAAVQSLDPARPAANPVEAVARERIQCLIFDTLAVLDNRGRPQPSLAVSWRRQADGRRWQFQLREGVKWHDGPTFSSKSAASALASEPGWSVSVAAEELVVESFEPIELSDFTRAPLALKDDGGRLLGTGPFRVAEWEPGRRLMLEANQESWGGRPFLDAIAIEMGRSYQEQVVEAELGKADLVEISPLEARRAAQAGLRTWASRPEWLLALVFPREPDARLREALALSIDRGAIASVLLQKHGEPAGALLPAWLTGYAVLFPAVRDLAKARQLVGDSRAAVPSLSLQYDGADPLARAVADRIAVNAREAGIRLAVTSSAADVRLARVYAGRLDARQALLDTATALGLADWLRLPAPANLEALHAAERSLVEDYRVVPLVHLPEMHASGARLRAPGPWQLADAWLEAP